jgi:hypothetical protein
MSSIKDDGVQMGDQRTISHAGLAQIREYVRYERIALGDATSFRTNHTYERAEQVRWMPPILGSVTITHRRSRPGPQSVECLRTLRPQPDSNRQV